MNRGTRKDHEKFVETEGWVRVRTARGGTGTEHQTFELRLDAGDILRSRISHPVNRTTYGTSLWTHVLRDQLHVSSDQFWDCASHRTLPPRSAPSADVAAALPADLIRGLMQVVGLYEADVRVMTKEQAIDRMNAHWRGE